MPCKHYDQINATHRHYIVCAKHNNCVLCAAESGPMTQQSIGNILNLTKERVAQIERIALMRFRRSMNYLKHEYAEHSVPEYSAPLPERMRFHLGC